MPFDRLPCILHALAALAVGVGLSIGTARAAQTDISPVPIASTTAAQVKPNVMLLMDASGSMGYTHMPDDVELVMGPNSVGYKASQCNALYYDPNKVYALPRRHDGVPFDPAVFGNARLAGFGDFYTTPDTLRVSLATEFRAYVSLLAGQIPTLRNAIGNDPAQQAYYYRHNGTPTLQDCQTPDTGAPNSSAAIPSAGTGTWTRVLVPGTAQEQNFANWFAYYRTRIALLKSAASLAFTPLTDTYRVGFVTVSPKIDPHNDAGISSSRFLKINDFSAVGAPSHRELWFNKLFSQIPGGSSPAREGLARVGRYYAGLEDGINTNMPATGDENDPLKYSCQRNFTIMTTDGYWNAQAESDFLGTQFGGGVRLDGKTKVGQQDGDYIGDMADGHCPISECPRPIFDGNTATERTTRDAWNLYDAESCTLPTSLQSVYRTLQTRSRWTASYERTTRREQFYVTTRTRDLATYTNTLLDKKKIKHTTEQYVRTTSTEARSAYQILRSDSQSSRTTTQATATSSQALARTYQIEQRDTRQPQTSVQHMQLRRQTSRVTVQHQLERKQFTLQQVQTRKHVFRYSTKLKTEEVFQPAENCGPPATHDCQTFTDFGPAFVNPDTCTDADSTVYPYWKTRCTAGPATAAATPVASCTPGTMDGPSPDHIRSICIDNVIQAPTFVASCAPGIDGSQVRTVCTNPPPNNATVTGVDPATCAASSGSAPDWIQVSCPVTLDETTYPNTACTSGTEAGFIVRTCSTPVNSTVYVGSCTPTVLPNNLQVSCGAVEPLGGPQIVDPTTCTTGPIAGPAYRTCTELPAGSYPTATYVSSCTAATDPGPPWIAQVCSYPAGTNYVNQPVPQSPACASGTFANQQLITCHPPTVTTAYVPPASCTPADGNSGPDYLKVECNGPVGVGPYATPTVVDPTTCTANPTGAAPDYVVTRCDSVPQAPSPICENRNSGPPNWIQYVCGSSDLVEPVAFCTVGTTNPSPGVTVVCSKPAGANNETNQPVTSCTDQLPNSGNSYVRRTCSTTVTQAQAPAPACTPFIDTANELEITSCVSNPIGTAYVDTCVAATDPNPPYATTTCSQPVDPSYNNGVVTPVPSCTVGTTWDANHIATTCTFTDTGVVAMSGGAGACPADQPPTPGNGYKTVDCETFASQPPVTGPTCTNVPPSAPNWEYKTCTPATPSAGPVNSAPCSDFVDGNEQVTCTRTMVSGPTSLSCTPGTTVGAGPLFDETVCMPGGSAPGQILRSTRTVTTTVQAVSGSVPVSTISTNSVTDAPVTYGSCVASVALPTPNPQRAPGDGTCAAWPCFTDVTPSTVTGSKNSLADVASYYYKTDLRPDDVAWPDNVSGPQSPNPEIDSAKHQHMTTFVLGLGVSGTLQFHPDYWKTTNTLGDFPAIRSGGLNWPVWPDPAITYTQTSDYENLKSIDDFWHTAVNGRGLFFNASDTASVVSGLNSALTAALETPLSGAGDASSTFSPVSGQDDYVYRSSYVPKGWKGDLEAFNQDDATGGIGSLVWSADALLQPRVKATCDERKIYFIRSDTSPPTLPEFQWNTDTCVAGVPQNAPQTTLNTTERAFFDPPPLPLNQYTSMLPYPTQLAAARGANLVNFLRGQKGFEDFTPGDVNRLFRKRTSVLGDFVNSQPVFVGKPFARYVESGYSQFVTDNVGRRKMLYIGGNDGMLHAFDALTGAERWAVIPGTVMPNLYKLADTNYDYQHEYFVDGSPIVGDVKIGVTPTWKTILVAGLNKGGKGYFALDITNPELPPVPLWEFKATTGPCPATIDEDPATATVKTDCNLGLTFGKPVITKLNGSWVVLVTSGYNNDGGGGFLYVLDAQFGTVIKKIPTNAGDSATPSGLAQINNFVDDAFLDNTTLRAYGGDLLGNIFRFEFAPTPVAQLIGVARNTVADGGATQPITTRPELAEMDGKPMVFVGTGKLLGSVDITDLQVQSVYGIVDPLTPPSPSAIYEPLRNALVPLQMVQTGYKATVKRTISCPAAAGTACSRTGGWVLDLKSTPPVVLPSGEVADRGERVNVNMQLVFGTLVFASNVPTPDPCNAAGHSYFNYVDFRTGLAAADSPLVNAGDPTSGNSTSFVGDALVAGFNIYRLADSSNPGGFVYRPISRNVDRSTGIGRDLRAAGPSKAKRISWREIVAQ